MNVETTIASYISEECPNGFNTYSLAPMVYNYRQQYHTKPVIVVDVISLMKFLYQDLDWLTGPRVHLYLGELDKFMQAFQKLGVELVFFSSGFLYPKNYKPWAKSQKYKTKLFANIFSQLSNNIPAEDIPEIKRKNFLPPLIFFATVWHLKYYYNCSVFTVLTNRFKIITQYAKENHWLGILGQHDNFLVINHGVHYFPMRHLKISDMTVGMYDLSVICHSLGISNLALPILATLLGNNYVQLPQLQGFYGRISRSRRNIPIIVHIANYIRAINLNNGISNLVVKKITRDIFKYENKASLIKGSINSYKVTTNAGEMITSEFEGRREIFAKAIELCHCSSMPSLVFEVLSKRTCHCRAAVENIDDAQENEEHNSRYDDSDDYYEDGSDYDGSSADNGDYDCNNDDDYGGYDGDCDDYENGDYYDYDYGNGDGDNYDAGNDNHNDIDDSDDDCDNYTDIDDSDYDDDDYYPLYVESLEELRKRIYKILLFNSKDTENVIVKEYRVDSSSPFVQPIEIKLTFDEFENDPRLLKLWSAKRSGSVQFERWSLFLTNISSDNSAVDRMNAWCKLDPCLLLPTAAMYYMWKNNYLAEYELYALLATVSKVTTYHYKNMLHNVRYSCIDTCALKISTMFTMTYEYMLILAAVCGYPVSPELLGEFLFDGELFQKKYEEALKEDQVGKLCEHERIDCDRFNRMKNIIMN